MTSDYGCTDLPAHLGTSESSSEGVVHGLFITIRRDKRIAEDEANHSWHDFTETRLATSVDEEIGERKGVSHTLAIRDGRVHVVALHIFEGLAVKPPRGNIGPSLPPILKIVVAL